MSSHLKTSQWFISLVCVCKYVFDKIGKFFFFFVSCVVWHSASRIEECDCYTIAHADVHCLINFSMEKGGLWIYSANFSVCVCLCTYFWPYFVLFCCIVRVQSLLHSIENSTWTSVSRMMSFFANCAIHIMHKFLPFPKHIIHTHTHTLMESEFHIWQRVNIIRAQSVRLIMYWWCTRIVDITSNSKTVGASNRMKSYYFE